MLMAAIACIGVGAISGVAGYRMGGFHVWPAPAELGRCLIYGAIVGLVVGIITALLVKVAAPRAIWLVLIAGFFLTFLGGCNLGAKQADDLHEWGRQMFQGNRWFNGVLRPLWIPMRTSTVVLVCILAAAEFAPGVAGEVVADGEFGFRLTIPDGFVKVPDKVQGDVLYAFMRPPAGDAKMGTVILVSRLRGVLGREKIAKQMAAKNPQIAVLEERWQEFDIEVFRVPEQVGDLKVVTFNAQVPLKPEAVQIGVFGEATRDNELRDLLQSLLSELDGETNWLTMQEREQRIAAGVTQLALCCSGAGFVTFGALVAAGLLIWRAVRKPKAKGNAGGKGSEPRQ